MVGTEGGGLPGGGVLPPKPPLIGLLLKSQAVRAKESTQSKDTLKNSDAEFLNHQKRTTFIFCLSILSRDYL